MSTPRTREFLLAVNARDFSAAVKCINILIELEPKNPKHLLNRAYCNLKLELYRKCVKDCDDALDLDKNLTLAYLRKAQAFHGMGKLDEAKTLLEKCLQESYDDVAIMQMVKHELLGDPVETAPVLKNASPTPSSSGNTSVSINPPSNLSTTPHEKPEDFELHDSLKEHTIDEAQASALAQVAAMGMVQNGTGIVGVDQRIAFGNMNINTGRYDVGISIFSQLIKEYPSLIAAYLGRGTGYALSGNLGSAIEDFSYSITNNPKNIDGLRRRAQCYSALGKEQEALADLNVCIELTKDAESYHQRGLSYHKLKNYNRAVSDLNMAIRLDHTNKTSYNFLGLCYLCLGRPKESVECYMKAIALDPHFKEAMANLGQAYKEWAKESLALESFAKSVQEDPSYSHGYYLRGLCYFGMGLHKLAYNDFTKSAQCDPTSFEARWMRGVSAAGLGMELAAINDFDAALAIRPDHYCWYQRQICLFWHHHMDTKLSTFNIDASLSEIFKECWCKRNPPSTVLKSSPQPPASSKITDVDVLNIPAWLTTPAMTVLTTSCKDIGRWIHQDSPGFLKNRRQISMAGFAAVEIAQVLRKVWGLATKKSSKSAKSKKTHPSSSNTPSDNNFILDGSYSSGTTRGPHKFGWRDMYDVAVKWRQYSEPNDPVWWVDMLTPDQFAEGFGSHTPIITGQCKVIRYGRMFERSLPIMKSLMKQQCVLSDSKLSDVDNANSVEELYSIMGRDFFVVTPCHSTASPGKIMEGTRLTIQSSPPEGFEYSIRTPGTPPRWVDYDLELTHLFSELSKEATKPNPDKEVLTNWILSITFYWYNFMPLARGTAATGYLTMMGMFLACGMQLQASIPSGVMFDWDAILIPTPQEFIETAKDWLLPYRTAYNMNQFDDMLPVQEAFPTLRHLLTVLNCTCSL